MFGGHAPAVLRGCRGAREGMGTVGIAARPVPLLRDRSPRDGGAASALHMERFVLGDAKKGHFQPWMGVRVVPDPCGWIQGRDWAGMFLLLPETCFPAFLCGKKPTFFSFAAGGDGGFLPAGLSASQGMGPQFPPAPPALDGDHQLGLDPSCPMAVLFPMCHPGLAVWELKISEMQGITGCLNISLL